MRFSLLKVIGVWFFRFFLCKPHTKDCGFWQHIRLISAVTSPPIWINYGIDELAMRLQRRERGQEWNDYRVDGKVVKSPADM